MRLTPRTRRGHPEAGFTLVELLIAVTILGLVAIPLGNAVIGYAHNADETTDRLVLSHDAQISGAYFGRDVAGVGIRDYTVSAAPLQQSIQVDAAYDAGGKTCGTAATPTATVRFLADSWDTSTMTATVGTDIVAYYLSGSGDVRELHRLKCVGSATPVSDVVVAHHVDPATVVLTCSSTCTGAAVPQSVTLAFHVTRPSVGAYPIRLTGQRRQT
ncbi:MAG TPA: prepilin-type N-terminal cleavage/methylation domain-containing protein [Catenuloplanes sp.]|jgi:prepilin-type N-terminal cleavage/methylation domain-containing protein